MVFEWPRSHSPVIVKRGAVVVGKCIIDPAAIVLVGVGLVLAVFAGSGFAGAMAMGLSAACISGVAATVTHELAHVVTALRYGFEVDYVRVGLGGMTEWYPRSGVAPAEQLRAVAAAGIISHLIQAGIGLSLLVIADWAWSWYPCIGVYTLQHLGRATENIIPRTMKGQSWPGLGGFDGQPNDGRILQRIRQLSVRKIGNED